MSIPGNNVKSIAGKCPMLVHGVSRLDLRCTFKSRPMFSDKAYKIAGVTRDSTGAILGNCIVQLYYTSNDVIAAEITSDSNGAFSFSVGPNLACYIVAYKAGSPDVAGTTLNTLIAV